MPRFATLDVGTNTVLLLVAEADGPCFRPVAERMAITRLGRDVDRTGRLDPQAVDDTVGAIARFAAEARALGAQDLACVATSAARDAQNGAEFRARVLREASVTAEIITGELEAQLSYEAATRDLGREAPLVVLDIGAGSTEVVFAERGRVTFGRSFALGSVRLTERHVRTDPPSFAEREAVVRSLDEAFAALPPPPGAFTLVGVAGTVTTVFTVARGLAVWDASAVHLGRLTAREVRQECERFWRLTTAQRSGLPGMPEKRADVIAAGSLVLDRAMARLGAAEVVVSDRGIRWGLLYHRFGHALQPRER